MIPIDISISFSDLPGLGSVARRILARQSVPYRLEGTIGVDAGRLGQPVFGPMTLLRGETTAARPPLDSRRSLGTARGSRRPSVRQRPGRRDTSAAARDGSSCTTPTRRCVADSGPRPRADRGWRARDRGTSDRRSPGVNQAARDASPAPPARNASTTSGPTSPQHAPRHGPIAATRSEGRDPNASCIARTAAPAAPAAVPRQPACAAPTARVTGSCSRIGAQSATRTPIATPGSSETMMSACGRIAGNGARRGAPPSRRCRAPA